MTICQAIFSLDVNSLCEEHNISFVSLVPNSMHLSQPLDVAFYRPLKRKWKKILKLWKMRNPSLSSLPKDSFPSLLKELVGSPNTDNLKSDFRACGIYPFSPQELITKLPQSEDATSSHANKTISSAVLEQLKRMHSPNEDKKKTECRKWVAVEPGKSVSMEDLAESDETDESEVSLNESEVSADESTIQHTNPALNQIICSNVIYEHEVFVGKVLQKTGGETMVEWLEKPYGIKEPQNLERKMQCFTTRFMSVMSLLD